jgi:hypothetical protein
MMSIRNHQIIIAVTLISIFKFIYSMKVWTSMRKK